MLQRRIVGQVTTRSGDPLVTDTSDSRVWSMIKVLLGGVAEAGVIQPEFDESTPEERP